MQVFKLILFSIALIVSVILIFRDYNLNNKRISWKNFLLPLLFILLIINNLREI